MGVAQQFLYQTQFHAAPEHQNGKRMPQHMRRDLCDASLPCIALDNQPETLARQSLAVMVEKQRLLLWVTRHKEWSRCRYILLCCLQRNSG